jgi:hypothetical protein
MVPLSLRERAEQSAKACADTYHTTTLHTIEPAMDKVSAVTTMELTY